MDGCQGKDSWGSFASRCGKRLCLKQLASLQLLKMIMSPRQARDKDRKRCSRNKKKFSVVFCRTSPLGTMLQSVMLPEMCIFSTPLPPPPPPPPPGPPKPACHTGDGGDCVIVRHVAVEILRCSSKRFFFSNACKKERLYKDDQFTRTGSGQTRGKLRERGGFLQAQQSLGQHREGNAVRADRHHPGRITV